MGRQAVVKSTLLNILSGIDKPTSGTVIFLNKLLNQLPEEQLAGMYRGKHLGFIFSFLTLCRFSMLDNVIFHWCLMVSSVKKKPLNGRCIISIASD